MTSSIYNQAMTTSQGEEEELAGGLYAMQLASFSILPMTLKAVIELNVLEIIAKAGPDTQLLPAEIAAQLPTQNPQASTMLNRMLRLLASYSVLTCSVVTGGDGRVQGRYGLTPMSRFFVKNKDGFSLVPLCLHFHNKPIFEPWFFLNDFVLDGEMPFKKFHGMGLFEYLATDPQSSKLFHDGMLNHSNLILNKLLETYMGFEGLQVLVDVGGGVGISLGKVISKYPNIKGINFDLPSVISAAPSYPGVEHVGGDMFVSVPSGDAIFMKWILHNWSDEQCLKILKNCWKALPKFGKVIVMEKFIPEAPETTIEAQLNFHDDLIMMGLFEEGKERTKKEFEALAKEAGFSGFKTACPIFQLWVMEFSK